MLNFAFFTRFFISLKRFHSRLLIFYLREFHILLGGDLKITLIFLLVFIAAFLFKFETEVFESKEKELDEIDTKSGEYYCQQHYTATIKHV
jgi:hypothetical protein